MNKRILLIVIAVLIVAALPVNVGAQEGDEPVRTGIRPDAPPYAVRGPYWVGTMELVIEDEERPLPVTVWYPALNEERVEETMIYPVHYPPTITDKTVTGHALPDAAVDEEHGPYPLVVFSHGTWAFRTQSVWLTEHLASYGFVVMALDHTGDTEAERDSRDPADFLVHRPLDVTRVIDFAAELTTEGRQMASVIDLDHVAVTGHSFGGYTALAAAGARMNFDEFDEIFCDQPDMQGMCSWFGYWANELPEIADLETLPEGMWPSLGDARVDVILPLAPGMTVVFGMNGLQAVEIPIFQLVGSSDTLVPPEIGAYWSHQHVGSANKTLVVFDNADHTIFENSCASAPWVELFHCSDRVWDFDRAHDLINHFTTAFLLAEFYSDEDAAAALSPDAVQFPGITYETTGF